jgi:hypothetical protein
MSVKKPLVLGSSGLPENLQSDDCIEQLNSISSFKKVGTNVFEVWYSTIIAGGATGTGSIVANALNLIPLIVSKTMTLDRIGLNVSTGVAASTARLGIYAASNCVPTTLIADFGTVSTAATGPVSTVVNITLTPGLYYFALISATAIGTMTFANGGLYPIMFYSAPGIAQGIFLRVLTGVTAASFPANFSSLTLTPANTVVPAIFYRLSA